MQLSRQGAVSPRQWCGMLTAAAAPRTATAVMAMKHSCIDARFNGPVVLQTRLRRGGCTPCRASSQLQPVQPPEQPPQQDPEPKQSNVPDKGLVGEDAAAFELSQQSVRSWGLFFVLLTVVLGALYVVWIRPGGGLAEDYLQALTSLTQDNTELTMVAILAVFAIAHSGLAGLRPRGERPGLGGAAL